MGAGWEFQQWSYYNKYNRNEIVIFVVIRKFIFLRQDIIYAMLALKLTG